MIKHDKKTSKKLPKYVEEEINNKTSYAGVVSYRDIKLSKKQKELFDLILKNKIVTVTGPAGTAKTFCGCYAALKCYTDKKFKKIIITKPTEVVGDSQLGFLPGGIEEKTAVYMESFVSVFSDIVEGKDLKMLMDNKTIEFKPVQFIRGSTWKNSVVIVDEFQSFDIKTLMAIVTRLGEGSKMIFLGDTNQNDINKKYVAVNVFKEILDGIKGTASFEFERADIVRDPILIEITDRYEKMKDEGRLTQTKGNT